MGTAKMKSISCKGGLTIVLSTNTTCDNPNSYTVEMTSKQGGKVYMGKDMTPVASVTEIPHSTLPAQSTGSINAIITVKPKGGMFSSLSSFIFARQVPIYMENNMQLVIDVNFSFGNFAAKKDLSKDCGLSVQMLSFGRPEIGPLACAESFAQLKIPAVGDQPQDGEMHLSAASLGGKEMEEGTRAKDIGLGGAMALGFVVGLLLLIFGVVTLCRRFRAAKTEVREQAREVAPKMNTTCELGAAQIGASAQPSPEDFEVV
eukprot:CAMPEP_0204073508 /NCGR_PEP_ID=MMETSP0360-20130528/163393_1 /ASSEMBLY_ACC=CAM_ASM_000342 /TAXON_ID=268821 /ORGANISM="Scrippsiella Hangoei, Strain SHTV-5" /LENGTH=259 /DNA_ID=CAMNT_0051021913 /DNA_START=106 /DNA_END=882 /DNA_ORIENTATION=-